MRFTSVPGISFLIAALSLAAPATQAPDTPAPAAQPKDIVGMPPRAAATEYQAQAKAGAFAIGAEFMGHSVPTPEATYNTEDYVVIEAGFFGAPDAKLQISWSDFSLRINNKKEPIPSEPNEKVLHSLKDPEWNPPDAANKKSATSINTGGQGANNNEPPAPVHMPFELQRPMEQRVHKASMPEGARALPQAGLLFFSYRGKPQNIRSLELIYNGPAGKATLTLQP